MLGNLLVIINDFPTEDNAHIGSIFVKEQISVLRRYFNNIFVIVPLPFGLEYKRKVRYKNYSYENVHVYFVKYINPLFPITWRYLKRLWVYLETGAVARFIKNNNISFDLINAHYSWPSGAVSAELKKMYSVPLVITEHAHVTLYPLIEKKDKVIVRTWNCADALVRVCRKDIPIFSSIFPKEKIFYIPNGYDQGNIKDMTKEEARKILNLPLDKNILFNLAILQNYKGHKYLIEAIQKVLQERSNILCLIGGDGPLKETLEEQIRHLGLEENVKLLGRIPHNEVSHWYSAADIFVLPSINESFGIVQIEAMACGKPVVATYNGGSEEIIISEDYGLLCDSTDSQQLAKNILVALNREWDAEKIRSYARGFTWEKNAEQTVKLFESIIGGQAFQTNEVMRTRSC